MPSKIASAAVIVAAALAVTACGSSKEAELEKQLAAAQAAAAQEAAAREAAEREASSLRAGAQSAALAEFYGTDPSADGAPADMDAPVDAPDADFKPPRPQVLGPGA